VHPAKEVTVGRLSSLLDREQQLAVQRRELAELRADNEKLRQQIARLRSAMRHCTTCSYHPRNRSE
jgi:cell division protein FtsB